MALLSRLLECVIKNINIVTIILIIHIILKIDKMRRLLPSFRVS